MKADLQQQFELWLQELTYGTQITRAELVEKLDIKERDLFWAFAAGWNKRFATLTTEDI